MSNLGNNEKPLISVVIPTYNREKTIERAVRSVLEQTYLNLEVIIVDDGSEDGTEAVVMSMGDERIRFIKQEQNQGASAARNKGVSYAKGELVAFQDSDDCWHSDKLEKQMDYWDRHPEYDMIYSAYTLNRLNGEQIRAPYENTWGELEGDIFVTLLVNNTIGTPTMLFRKQCFVDIGGFDETLECLEDWELAIRFAEKYRIGYVEKPLMDAYLQMGGVSSSLSKFFLNRCKMIVKYKKQLLEHGIFNSVVETILVRAKEQGVLEQVQTMFMSMLSK